MNRPGQLALDLGHRPALGRADFLVAPGNADAVAWIDSWPNWNAFAIAVSGPPGCGKTHLAQVFAARSGAEFVASTALEDAARRVLQGTLADAVLEAADGAEDVALFHLLNAFAERKGHLLLTSRTQPSRWNVKLPDLRSRLRALPQVRIASPDDDTLAAVLIKLFGDRQLAVRAEVVSYLARRMERSFEAARDLVAELDARALAERREITIALAREVLRTGEEGSA